VLNWLSVGACIEVVLEENAMLQGRFTSLDKAVAGEHGIRLWVLEEVPSRRLRWCALCTAVLASFTLQACSTPSRLEPEPAPLTTKAIVIDTPNARFYPDEQVTELYEEGIRSIQREMKVLSVTDPSKLPQANFLAVSGGGGDGAFGAGLLSGWTKAGTRPEFKLVTGVSTGALIAPFAFLGPAYDEQLKRVFTTVSAKDIYIERGLRGALFDDALSDTTPLFNFISGYVNEEMLTAIARAYEKGRLLLIGTTNLDARRPVIWNMGAIAASGHPKAPDLFRKILLASAAIPAAFPPVMIDVEVDGKQYQEMHVDGGAIAQLFLYPPDVGRKIVNKGIKRERRAYIIRNGALGEDWSAVERSTLDIAGRAISTMIYMSGVNDLFRVYMITQRDGVDYNVAYIEDDFEGPPNETGFDPTYLNALFAYGYEKARNGYAWKKTPPYVDVSN